MTQQQDVNSMIGMQVRDAEGAKIGKIGQIWVREDSGEPAWMSVRTGMFSSAESFVPMDRKCRVEADSVHVPFDKDMVRHAPQIEVSGDMASGQQDELYRYYNLDPRGGATADRTASSGAAKEDMATGGATDTAAAGDMAGATVGTSGASAGATSGRTGTGTGSDGTTAGAAGVSDTATTSTATAGTTAGGTAGATAGTTSGEDLPERQARHRSTDESRRTDEPMTANRSRSSRSDVRDEGMIRSEERLRVGTESTESGRVRLHKHVVTEHVTTTVPLRHEEVHIEREPITEAGGARGDITEDEREVVLHAEHPVVNTETVAVERVRLSTETVTEQQSVEADVRKERIDVDDPEGATHPRTE